MVDEIQRQRSFSPGMRRMGRQENDTPMRNPIDMAPPRKNPYRNLPIPPNYERSMPSPLPIPPGYERGPYRPLPITPDYDRQLPIPPDYGPGPMPSPPPFTPEEIEDYFNRRTGFNTSETARENFISRTDGGYPDRQDPSFMDKYGDYINRGLEYMPTPFPGITLGTGSRILRGLGSLYGGNAAEYIDELPATPLQEDDEASGIMGAMPQERQTSGLIQTWRKIFENVGEDAANEWLASQQAAVQYGIFK